MSGQIARLLKGTAIYGLGSVANRFLGLLFLPLFTSYLTPKDYGIIAILAVITSLLVPIFTLGIGAGLGPCYFDGNSEKRKCEAIWTAFLLIILSALSMVALGAVFETPINKIFFGDEDYSFLVRMTVWSSAITLLQVPLSLRMQFEERSILFVALAAVSTITTLGLTVLFVAVLKKGALGYVQAGLCSQAITTILYLVAIIPTTPISIKRELLLTLLKLSAPLIPSFAFIFLMTHGNKYILQKTHGLDEVGLYAIGLNFGMAISLPITAFQTSWYPYFMSFMDKQDEAAPLFGRIFTFYAVGMGTISLFFFIFAKLVVLTMAQPPFHEAHKIIGIVAASQFLMGMVSILLPAVYFSKDMKYVSIIQFISSIFFILMGIALIRSFGLWGAACSQLGGALILLGLQHGWNKLNTDKYFSIKFQPAPLARFMVVYSCFAIFYSLDRSLSTAEEIALALISSAILIIGAIFALDAQERLKILAISKEYALKYAMKLRH